jgi:hypothetical protein
VKHEVRLGVRPRGVLMAGLFAACLASGALAEGVVTVTLRHPPDAHPVDATVSATRLATSRGGEGTNRVVASGPSTTEFALAISPGVWQLSVSAPGYWVPDREIAISPAQESDLTVEVALSRTGRLSGTLPDAMRGRALRAVLRPALDGPGSPNGGEWNTSCRTQESTWNCDLPEGTFDVQLRSKGLVPVYLWGIVVKAGVTRQVGTVAMAPGASVSGRVEFPRGVPAQGATIFLATQDGVPLDPGRGGRPFNARTDRRGFFQLRGVPPGRYQVVARREGSADVGEPITIFEGAESALRQAIELVPPATLGLQVTPPVDPVGEPWAITLLRGDESPIPVIRAQAVDSKGRLRPANLPLGHYRAQVEASFGARWAIAEFDLEAEGQEIVVDAPSNTIRGSVTLGETLLPEARIVFGGRSGLQKVEFKGDREGRFEGVLPGSSGGSRTWTVMVAADEPPISRTLHDVVVADGDELNLVLPDAEIEGHVVDESGIPVSPALIVVERPNGSIEQLVTRSQDGSFRMAGLDSGAHAVSAESRLGHSTPTTIDLQAGQRKQAVTLVIKTTRELEVAVRAPEGIPVPGAQVKVLPLDRLQSSSTIVRSDGDGLARFSVPADSKGLGVAIGAVGFAYWIGQIPASEGLQVTLSRLGGTLRVRIDDTVEGVLPYLLHDGFVESPVFLARWAAAHGATATAQGEWLLPEMGTGRYSLCGVPPGQLGLLVAGAGAGFRCVSGVLEGGQELSLTLGE